jgi:hypothetical protein
MTLTPESWYGKSKSYHNWSLPFILLLKVSGAVCDYCYHLNYSILCFFFSHLLFRVGYASMHWHAETMTANSARYLTQNCLLWTACLTDFVIWLILICKYFQGGRRCRMQSHQSLFMLLIGFHAYLFLQFLLLSLWSLLG